MYTYAITGHRPNKLYGYDWNSDGNKKLMSAMKYLYNGSMKDYYDIYGDNNFTWYVGGDLGVSQMSHQVLNEIKQEHPEFNITIILAEPFDGFWGRWNIYDVRRYTYLKGTANIVVDVSKQKDYEVIKNMTRPTDKYLIYKMLQKRNEYMVDNCNELIAFWDGTSGDTANCVNYAKSIKKSTTVYNPKNF